MPVKNCYFITKLRKQIILIKLQKFNFRFKPESSLFEILRVQNEKVKKFIDPDKKTRNTHIVCTIGPASRSVEKLEELIDAGMDICRLNFSHGDHTYHADTIRNIRQAIDNKRAKKTLFKPVALALDTKGPEIRTGLLKGGGSAIVNLVKGNKITLSLMDADKESGDIDRVWVDYKNLPKVIGKNDLIFVDDGLISLKVLDVSISKLTFQIFQFFTI